jgi:hypothetical protein
VITQKDGQFNITEFRNNHMSNQRIVVLFVRCGLEKMKRDSRIGGYVAK